MMNIVEIKNAIQYLPVEDFNELMVWLAEYENEKWDKQTREDYQAGKLDKRIQDAMVDGENAEKVCKILLIDIDNCPSEMEKVIQDLNSYVRIIICYGGQIPKISLNLINSLAEAIYKKKIEIIGMKKKGKNAADFGLCFWAGRLSVQVPIGTEFTILSKDADLDHLINLLTEFGYKAERLGVTSDTKTTEIETVPQIIEQKIAESEIITIADQYFRERLSNKPNRPATEDKLLNSVKSFCRDKCPGKEKAVFNSLKEKGYFTILTSGKIQYIEVVSNLLKQGKTK